MIVCNSDIQFLSLCVPACHMRFEMNKFDHIRMHSVPLNLTVAEPNYFKMIK